MKKSIKYYVSGIKGWIRKNPREAVLLGLILVIGAFFRLYKIADYMTFLGDEGRDAIIVRRLLVNFDPILIGPGTSIGNIYLGPLYYYMIAPFLFLANYSPVGPAVMIAFLGIITIFLVWYISRIWFGKTAAFIASLLYAISPIVIIYSRSSWNPNIMPFFALLSIFALWKIWRDTDFKWLPVLGISFAFVLQSHYLGLLLSPTILIFYCLTIWKLKNTTKSDTLTIKQLDNGKHNFIIYSLISAFLFLFLMSPLVIFDARHGWRNFAAIKTFFTQRESTVSVKPWKAIPSLYPIFRDDYVTRIITAKEIFAGRITTFLLTFAVFAYITIRFSIIKDLLSNVTVGDESKKAAAKVLLVSWIGFGLIGLGLYKQHIYDHYFGFIFPAGFILLGAIAQGIYSKFGDDGKILITSAFVLLVVANLAGNPLRYPPNNQLQRAIDVADLIRKESNGEKMNLAVIAEQNYEDGYQYFLEKWNQPVFDIDPLNLKDSVANQLFVVCEMKEDKCDPTHSPKAEIANFGWSKIDNKWSTDGVVIFKLVHTQ